MKRAQFAFDIEELVLVGFDRSAGAELAQELSRALTRALNEEGLPPGWSGSEASMNLRRDFLRLEASSGVGTPSSSVADSLVRALYTGPSGPSGED